MASKVAEPDYLKILVFKRKYSKKVKSSSKQDFWTFKENQVIGIV